MTFLGDNYRKEEKIDGVIYDTPRASHYKHGIVNGNISVLLRKGLKDSLCLVFQENLDFQYHPEQSDDYVVPDVMIVSDRTKLKENFYTGVPEFVVETLSPSTAMRDLSVKKNIYETSGVSEYWIVSSKERGVQIYYLTDGRYKLANSYILEDDKDNEYYNAETIITLREFPHIKMTLADIFEDIE